MSIDIKDVEKLAKLSRLEFTDVEKQEFSQKLNQILEFASQLQEVNTDGVEPMSSAVGDASTPMRDDVVTEENHRDEYLSNAPSDEMGFFVVPKVIE